MQKHTPVYQQVTHKNAQNHVFQLPEIDLTRNRAVYIRQSGRKADNMNGVSRKMQEVLRNFIPKMRGQETMSIIRMDDEEAGKSGGRCIESVLEAAIWRYCLGHGLNVSTIYQEVDVEQPSQKQGEC